jgi:hypothetical protein
MPLKAIGRVLGLGPQKTTTSQTSTPTRPAEVAGAVSDLISRARTFADQPFEAYDQPRIAGLTPDELAGFEAARGVAATSGALAPLTADLVQEGVAASRGLATRLPETDLSGYMSPFTQAVLDPAIRAIEERAAQERLRLGQQSARTGSFGGSRQAIAESELERGTQRNIGEETARQRANAYNQALQQFRIDQERIPALFSGALGQVGTGLQQTAARLGTEVAPLTQIGGAQRALTQAELDFEREQFEEERDFPLRGIEVLRSVAGLPAASLGVGTTGTTTSTQPGPNVLGQIGGALMSAPSLISGGKAAIGGLSSLGSSLGSLGSAALAFLSDERMKTDIEEVGEDPESGLMMYAFRYEGDPKTYPKVIGPLAQEVEDMYPEEVGEIGGFKTVRSDFAPMQRGALS